MKNFFKNGKNLLWVKQTSILSAAFVMMAAVFVSRFLGLVRDRLLANFFSPHELGIYFAAFRIPDIIFSILVMGALTTAFIPVITQFLTDKKEDEAWQTASSVINIGGVIFLVLSLIIFLFSRQFCYFIAPGFSPAELDTVSNLTRVMLSAQFFFIISNFLTGVLQADKRFIIPALSPIVYNLGIISGIIVLSPFLGIFGPAVGVVIGAFFHLVIQIPVIRSIGYRYSFNFRITQGVRKIWRLMLPRTIGLIASQINYTVDNILASLISSSSITVFTFATHFQQLPIGLFGATIAQASLPTLSEENAKNNYENFYRTLFSSFKQILFLTIPSCFLIIILRVPFVRLIFGAIKFDWQATILTGMTLAFLSLGIVFQSSIHLFARAFYSLHDSRTPLYIGLFSVFVNVFFSLFLVSFLKMPVWGLAISSTLSDFSNAILLIYYIGQKIKINFFVKTAKSTIKIITASILAAIFAYLTLKVFDIYILDTTRTINLIFLTLSSLLIGVVIYVLSCLILNIEEIYAFEKLWSKAKNVFGSLKESSLEVNTQEQILS